MSKGSCLPAQRRPWIKILIFRSSADDSIFVEGGQEVWDVALARIVDPSFIRVCDEDDWSIFGCLGETLFGRITNFIH
jgi:hypothetical protein